MAEAPVRWWWAIFACLMAHPLIDAFTIYGTQLFWPLPMRPIMWSSLFIVDPLFTLPWLLACVVAWVARERLFAQRALVAGIVLGVGYVGWSLVAKAMVDQAAAPVLAARGLGNAPWFSVPMPLTTQRWRVVAMTGDGYVEGERALAATGPMRLRRYPSDTAALASAGGLPAVRRLRWFNHGFMSAQVHDGQLQLSDLRMGQAPDYVFRFAVAVRDGDGWRAIPPFDPNRQQLREALRKLWQQWRGGQPVQAAFGRSAAAPADSASK